jgi:hypothetical protein
MREQKLAELQTQNLKYEQKYYQSGEYQELAIRQRLGYANPGEKVLVLPPNTLAAQNADAALTKKSTTTATEPISNFQQWVNFLFGGSQGSA